MEKTNPDEQKYKFPSKASKIHPLITHSSDLDGRIQIFTFTQFIEKICFFRKQEKLSQKSQTGWPLATASQH